MASRAEIMYRAHRMYPALFRDSFDESWLHPDMLKLVKAFKRGGGGDKKNSNLMDSEEGPILKEETKDVYSFNCFNPKFIQMFNEEIDHFYTMSEKLTIPVRRPNSMNNYGVIVNDIGMQPMITAFQQDYLWPIARYLFPIEGSQFDDHHSFLVRYQADEDLGLDMHTDDSDVTFNVCLGHTFTGATLSFCGYMGSSDHRQFVHKYLHEVGRAVLHLGSRRHGADDIETGTRVNLIVWNHNYKYRRSFEYQERHSIRLYNKEQAPPDPICLSYTHDRDYTAFKTYPPAAKKQVPLRPWCPPSGKEYDGYGQHKKSSSAKEDAEL